MKVSMYDFSSFMIGVENRVMIVLNIVYCGRGISSDGVVGMAYVRSNRNRYISKVNYIYFSVECYMYSSARGEC